MSNYFREYITPYKPLASAIARVKNPLPAPETCHYCGGKVHIVGNEVVYGKKYGNYPWMFLCTSCKSYVGIHPQTAIPLGTLANKETRQSRSLAKDSFNLIKDHLNIDRSAAYQWLSEQMNLPVDETHIGWFDIDQCNKVVEIYNTLTVKMKNLYKFIGKTISTVVLTTEDKIHFVFTDDTKMTLYDNGQQCCELRYITTDDDLSTFSGSVLLGIVMKSYPVECKTPS